MIFEKISKYFDRKIIRLKYKWFGIKPVWPDLKPSPRKNEFFIETCPYSGYFYPKIRVTKEKVINYNKVDVFVSPKIETTIEEYFIWIETRAPKFFDGQFQMDLSYRYPLESRMDYSWTNESEPRKSVLPCRTKEEAMDRIKLYDELVLGNNIKKDLVSL